MKRNDYIAMVVYFGVLIALALFGMLTQGCFQAAGQPFPTSQQLMTACDAELAKGIPPAKAPDCGAHYAIQMACNAEALGPAINPLVTTINPVAGSILTVQASLSEALCAAQGFYAPAK